MSIDSAHTGVDVNELMLRIQERARQSSEEPRAASYGANPLAGVPDLARLRFSATELREVIRHVNELPPSPPTLRGRVGSIFVGIMSRLFAWQRAQAHPFQAAVVNNSDEQQRAIEALSRRVEAQAKTLESLTRELVALRLSARQEQERLEKLLAEETHRAREFEAGCRSFLNRLEHEILQRNS